MDKNNNRRCDIIDSILYRASKDNLDKILGAVFNMCGLFFTVVSIGVIILIFTVLLKLVFFIIF